MRNTSSDESPLKGSGEADLERERERGDVPSLDRGWSVGEGDAVRRRFLPSFDRSRGDLESERSRSAVSFISKVAQLTPGLCQTLSFVEAQEKREVVFSPTAGYLQTARPWELPGRACRRTSPGLIIS